MSTTPPEEARELTAMLKRRGFIKPAYELYGGVAGFYDYGPLGQGLKRRFEDLWREHYVVDEGFGEVSTPTIAPRDVFEASGHLDQFDDVLVECSNCRAGSRADHLLEDEFERLIQELEDDADPLIEQAEADDQPALQEALETVTERFEEGQAIVEHEADEATIEALFALGPHDHEDEHVFGPYQLTLLPTAYQIQDTRTEEVILSGTVRCPECGQALPEDATVAPFNLMFATRIGPGTGEEGYARPETAQGLFVNMPWLYRYNREKIPFGAVQIGRAYRNEISPRQGLIRLREFWQAEAEVFVDPHDKTHPRFEEAASARVELVPADGDTLETTLGSAVEKGIVGNEQVAWYIWRTLRILTQAGVDEDRLRFRQHESDEMAHYAADCWDAEFHSDRYGWVECVGIADRGCYDLERHQERSQASMEAFQRYEEPREEQVTRIEPDMSQLGPRFKDKAGTVAEKVQEMDPEAARGQETLVVSVDGDEVEVDASAYEVVDEVDTVHGERFLPHVIEPSYGIDRILYAVLEHNWTTSQDRDRLELPPRMAPVQVGVLPLVSKDGLPEKAREVERSFKRRGLVTRFDDGGSIGRRYARLDEIGTPLAVTVDHETLEEGTVTVRDRDSQEQARLPVGEGLADRLWRIVEGRLSFEELA